MQDGRSSSGCRKAFAHLLKTHIAHYAHNYTNKCVRPEDLTSTKSLMSHLNMDSVVLEQTLRFFLRLLKWQWLTLANRYPAHFNGFSRI